MEEVGHIIARMKKATVAGALISLIFALAGCKPASNVTATASPTPDPCAVPVPPLRVGADGELPPNSPTLSDDLQCTETDPNGGRFRMIGRFQRAEYNSNTRPDGLKIEMYGWIYPDAFVTVNLVTFPKGMLTGESAEKRAEQAEKIFDSRPGSIKNKRLSLTNVEIDGRPGKQYELQIGAQKLVVRSVFNDEHSAFYQIVVGARIASADPAIQKVLNSFAFVKR
jgi:hypothetical protein